jgi:hypothetical protein
MFRYKADSIAQNADFHRAANTVMPIVFADLALNLAP